MDAQKMHNLIYHVYPTNGMEIHYGNGHKDVGFFEIWKDKDTLFEEGKFRFVPNINSVPYQAARAKEKASYQSGMRSEADVIYDKEILPLTRIIDSENVIDLRPAF
jgi:hypothetical protein